MLYYALRQTCHSIFPSGGTDGDVGAKGTQRYTSGEWEGGVLPNLPDGVRMATPWYPLTTDDRNTAGFFLGSNGSYQPTTVVLCKVGVSHHFSTPG